MKKNTFTSFNMGKVAGGEKRMLNDLNICFILYFSLCSEHTLTVYNLILLKLHKIPKQINRFVYAISIQGLTVICTFLEMHFASIHPIMPFNYSFIYEKFT